MKTWEPGAKRDWIRLAMIVIGAPLLIAGIVASWPSVYAYLSANPFRLVFICGGMAVAFVLLLFWLQTRPAPSEIFCADESRKPWEE